MQLWPFKSPHFCSHHVMDMFGCSQWYGTICCLQACEEPNSTYKRALSIIGLNISVRFSYNFESFKGALYGRLLCVSSLELFLLYPQNIALHLVWSPNWCGTKAIKFSCILFTFPWVFLCVEKPYFKHLVKCVKTWLLILTFDFKLQNDMAMFLCSEFCPAFL